MTDKISVMIIADSVGGTALEFCTLPATLPAFTEAIECQYMDASIGANWGIYFNEEPVGRTNDHAIRLVQALDPIRYVSLHGRCLVFGRNGSEEIDLPDYVIDTALIQIPEPEPGRVCLYRFGNQVHVYDDQPTAVKDLHAAIVRHRDVDNDTPIEAYFNLSRNRWVELRVEIMDQPVIDLHDHRNDRSYG